MKNRFLSALLTVSMLFGMCAVQVRAADYTILYISPSGSDSGDGSIQSPYRTIEAAKNKIKALKADGALAKDGAVVYLREGKYPRTSPLVFTAEDSGSENAPIVYRSYPGERAELVGGITVTASQFAQTTDTAFLNRIKDVNARANIKQVNLRQCGYSGALPKVVYKEPWYETVGIETPYFENPLSVYCGEQLLTPARYPNGTDTIKITDVIDKGQDLDYWLERRKGTDKYIEPEDRDKTAGFTIKCNDDRVFDWVDSSGKNKTGGLLYGYWSNGWSQFYVDFTADKTAKTIKSTMPIHFSTGMTGGSAWYFWGVNMPEELDYPGEYYVDSNGMMYIYLPQGAEENGITVSVLNSHMIEAQGASYITFKDIDFSYANGGVFRTETADHFEFYGCNITLAKETSVVGGTNNGFRNCTFSKVDIAAQLYGGDRTTLTPANNYIENCEVSEFGYFNKTKKGIYVCGVGNTAKFNEIHNGPYTGISFLGNNHTIEYNNVYDVVKETSDQGAVYATNNSVTDRGTVLRYNYIHNSSSVQTSQATVGIYLDNVMSGTLVAGNIISDIQNGSGIGIHLGGSRDMILYNNIITDTGTPIFFDDRSNWESFTNPTTGHIFRSLAEIDYKSEIWRKAYPELYNIMENQPTMAMGDICKNNLIVNSGKIVTADSYKDIVIKNNYETGSDPGFYDSANGMYLLKNDSNVFRAVPEFKQLPITRMGRYNQRAKDRTSGAAVICTDSPYMYADGEMSMLDSSNGSIFPRMYYGVLYVPLRSTAEKLGASVEYEGNTATVTYNSIVSSVTLNSKTAQKDSQEITLQGNAALIDGSMYVPSSAFNQLMDLTVYTNENGVTSISDGDIFTPGADQNILDYLHEELTLY